MGWTLCWLFVVGCGEPASPPSKSDAPTLPSERQTPPVQSAEASGESVSTPTAPDTAVPSVAEPVYDPPAESREANQRNRLADDRPAINELRLQQNGIRLLESKRLRLLTDLPEQDAAGLPDLADELFEALEQHFGKLPPAIDGSEFQVTGHLIADEKKFQAAGLMPSAAFTFDHGRHLNYQFWMYNTPKNYYRRHLLLHEFTHCFMTCESGMQDIPPLWYIEGMAEYFATHRTHEADGSNQKTVFGILPTAEAGFEGWGRIAELRRSFPQKFGQHSQHLTIPSLNEVMPTTVTEFGTNLQYARSWALCWLLQTHSDYAAVFRSLSSRRRRTEFLTQLNSIRKSADAHLTADWLLTVETLREGFDVKRSFPVHAEQTVSATELAGQPFQFNLRSANDWQDSGLRLSKNEAVRITCSGRYQVNSEPAPWISEPQGVSIEYYRGRPLGEISGIFVGRDGDFISARFPIGRSSVIKSSRNCSLWLQVNDSPASRENNDGTAQILINSVE